MSYDDWKLSTPPEYDEMPEPEEQPPEPTSFEDCGDDRCECCKRGRHYFELFRKAAARV
jgi:hypothetical protein